METFVETKSKQLAFSFTIVIHLLFLLLFLLTGFVKPLEQNIKEQTASGYARTLDFEFVELNNSVVVSKTSPSEKLVSNPNEKEYKIEQSNGVVKRENVIPSENTELKTVLNKWKQLKARKIQQGNSPDTDLKAISSLGSVSLGTIENGMFNLTNRSLVVKPKTIVNDSEEGKVVVDIIVNEEGKVISAIPGQRGSTTTSTLLYQKAVKAAYTAQFNAIPNGIKEQRGTYTFVFTLE